MKYIPKFQTGTPKKDLFEGQASSNEITFNSNDFNVPNYIYKQGGIIYAQKGKKLPPLPLFETNKIAFVDSVLDANKNIEWVKRLYGPQKNNALYNIIPGQISTHLMGHNGKGLVFPHIVKDNGKLKYLETDDSAEEYAKQNNTGIQFKTPEQAAWFSADGYKMGTGVFGKNLKPNRLL